MRVRRVIRAGAALVAGAVLLTGCTTASSGKSGGPEVTGAPTNVTGPLEVVSFYPAGSPDYARLQALAKAFEAKYPGTSVKLVFGGGQDAPAIQARWRAGNPPEVNYGFFGNTDLRYVKAGQVEALDGAMGADLAGYGKSWRDAIAPAVRPLLTDPEDGKIYAVPEAVTTIQFFYNKKMFDQLGVTPPKTLDELFTVADKVKASGKAPFAVTGTFVPYMQLYWDYLLLRRTGAANVQAALSGTKDFNTLPGVNEAAADLQKMVSSGYFLDGFKSTDFTAAQLAFFQGKTAMILMGSWLTGEMKDSIPADFQLGTFAFPSVSGAAGDQNGVFGGVNAQTVAKQSKNPQAGIAWLRFVAEKTNQEAYVKSTGEISAYEGVSAPPGFADQAAMLSHENAFAPSYFGVLSNPKLKDAWDQPIAQLFFGQTDAAGLVKAISDGLTKATG